jgi:hypothetical protein
MLSSQAEVAVDCLNLRIRELEHEREKYLGEVRSICT